MKLYYIKERDNPQLGTYFVACGQLFKKEAKSREGSLYGSNIMHGFYSKEEYEARLQSLRNAGEKVQ